MLNSLKHSFFSFLIISTIPLLSFAQGNSIKETPKNWHQLDKKETGYNGISLDKAYQFVKGKKSKTVLVAVIDSGVDTTHEDLKGVLWHNPKEIPGNGIDDDHNGYVDDVYGWNFIGGKDGRNVTQDSDEGSRVYYKFKAKYGDVIPDPSKAKTPEEKNEIEMYLRAKEKIEAGVDPADIAFIKRILPSIKIGDSIISKELNKTEYTCEDLKNYFPTNVYAVNAKAIHMATCKLNNDNNDISNKDVIEDYERDLRKADVMERAPIEYRKEIVKDDESNINDKYYGNNDVMAGETSWEMHGTHCAGIIGAVKNNDKGIKGIADNVKIMMVRALPDGDEHDKDIALGIRYAVDNGAQIISMSFGKDFSPQKKMVDDAMKYAESKGVLLVQASGNDAKNIDTAYNFPSRVFADGTGRANNLISVGASGDATNGGLIANFSNYGKKEVDIFSPGVKIYSTLPGSNYGKLSGTSMAAPVVTGVAAFLLEYYPDLSAKQLKYVIEKSATTPNEKVNRPGTSEKIDLSEISKTGGFLNAYEAVKLAATIKGDRNTKEPINIKPKIITNKKG